MNKKLILKMTCEACPEQYDAYDTDDVYVGYFRLRHGSFTVDNATKVLVYHSHTIGDGYFDRSERDTELLAGVRALGYESFETDARDYDSF